MSRKTVYIFKKIFQLSSKHSPQFNIDCWVKFLIENGILCSLAIQSVLFDMEGNVSERAADLPGIYLLRI